MRAFESSTTSSLNSDQVVVSQFPFSSLDEMAGSLGYFSAFSIRYSGVVFADMFFLSSD